MTIYSSHSIQNLMLPLFCGSILCLLQYQAAAQQKVALPSEISAVEFLGNDQFVVVGDNELNQFYQFSMDKNAFANDGQRTPIVAQNIQLPQAFLAQPNGLGQELEATAVVDGEILAIGERSQNGLVALIGNNRIHAEYDVREFQVAQTDKKDLKETIEGLDTVEGHVGIVAEGGHYSSTPFVPVHDRFRYPQLFVHQLGNETLRYRLDPSTNNPIEGWAQTTRNTEIRASAMLFAEYGPSGTPGTPAAVVLVQNKPKPQWQEKWLLIISFEETEQRLIGKAIPFDEFVVKDLDKNGINQNAFPNWEGMCWCEDKILMVADNNNVGSDTLIMKIDAASIGLQPPSTSFAIHRELLLEPTETPDYFRQRSELLAGTDGTMGTNQDDLERLEQLDTAINGKSTYADVQAWLAGLDAVINEIIVADLPKIKLLKTASAVNFPTSATENAKSELDYLMSIYATSNGLIDEVIGDERMAISFNDGGTAQKTTLKQTDWYLAGQKLLKSRTEISELLANPTVSVTERSNLQRRLELSQAASDQFQSRMAATQRDVERALQRHLFELYAIRSSVESKILIRYSRPVYESQAGRAAILLLLTTHQSDAAHHWLQDTMDQSTYDSSVAKLLRDAATYQGITNEVDVRATFLYLANLAADNNDPKIRSMLLVVLDRHLKSKIDFTLIPSNTTVEEQMAYLFHALKRIESDSNKPPLSANSRATLNQLRQHILDKAMAQ